MDKNTLIGMLLMGAVIFGFMWLNQPSEAEMAERQRQIDSIAAVEKAEQRHSLAAGNVDTLAATEQAQLLSVLQNVKNGRELGEYVRGIDANGNYGLAKGVEIPVDRTPPSAPAAVTILPDDWTKYEYAALDFTPAAEGGTLWDAITALSRYLTKKQAKQTETLF